VEDAGDAHEGVRFHDVVAHRGGKEVLRPLDVPGNRNVYARLVHQFLFQEVEGIDKRRRGNRRSVPPLGKLGCDTHGDILRNEADLRQEHPSNPGNEGIVDGQGTVDRTAPAHGTPVERLHHGVDVAGRQFFRSDQPPQKASRRGEIATIDPPQEVGPPGRQIVDVTRGLKNRALPGAVVAPRAGVEVHFQRTVV
jgi:hypothetical protein